MDTSLLLSLFSALKLLCFPFHTKKRVIACRDRAYKQNRLKKKKNANIKRKRAGKKERTAAL